VGSLGGMLWMYEEGVKRLKVGLNQVCPRDLLPKGFG
jgi:hypothetical protein